MTYIEQILALGQEEQRICAGRGDGARLAAIEAERARLWDAERARRRGCPAAPAPTPEPRLPTAGPKLPRLPTGVAWVETRRPGIPSTVRAVVYLSRRDKVYQSGFPSTPEGIALAERAAEAGRAARDAGESRERIKRAMEEVRG